LATICPVCPVAPVIAWVQDTGANEPQRLADHLLLLVDGAMMAARLFGPDNPAQGIADTAAALIDAPIQTPAVN
jgi:hypothetical protein